ncbi:hypothetical protein [Leifsonia sp. fls2-241-R2A-40a]|uniref:hypothetical protein n=1 Tax=Leifsonia sp. fls2-241-R2A-40a TaxID=3040290 RepID=UPI00254E7F6F|nr:hypothetical protein [Leifsonia sp. fls2-241-R2A-40a]
MQWWNDFVDWFSSPAARPAIFYAVVLAVAVILSGLIAAWIARGALKGLLSRTDRQQKASAIAALVDAATEASVWNSLTPGEQVLSDRAVGQADIMVRLLPIKGSGLAANWAGHQLAEMKRASATFGYQLDPAIAEFRDRLLEWQNNPRRARKIFQSDLERWRFESTDTDRSVVEQQDAWVAQQHHEQYAPATAATPAPTAATAQPAAAAAPAEREEQREGNPFVATAAAGSADPQNDTAPTARLGQPV